MKSAIEIAMEKANKMEGGKNLTIKQKNEITEIRKITEAKIAEAKIMLDDKISKLEPGSGVIDEAQENFNRDRRKIEENAENKIKNIREEG